LSYVVELDVVLGIVTDAEQRVLVALRADDAPQGKLWEFPGGKIKSGETAQQAIKRELVEEINIEISVAKRFARFDHIYSDYKVNFEVWRVLQYSGIPRGQEGQSIRWVAVEDLAAVEMPSANAKIVHHLLR